MERYRIHRDGAVYYVTYSVVEWLPVFATGPALQIVADSLNFCFAQKSLRINAFVIMPTHLHAIVFDAEYDSGRLEQTLTDFRKFTGKKLCDYAAGHLPGCFSEAFRKAAGNDRERRFWQSSRHPATIETESFWRQKMDYLHENPCRKGLVVRAIDWRYSSAAYWLSEGTMESVVRLSAIEW
jgi:REP element-mobilizing transposase RayT